MAKRKIKNYLAGGVNSPLRAFLCVGGNPIIARKAEGSKLFDADGKRYIDFCQSFGALALGHSNPHVVSAVKSALAKGSSFGLTCENEIKLASEICSAIPTIQKIRFTNSGTEAVMAALKLARGFSKKNKILKFKGCYHGWSEQPYVEATYNDLVSVEKLATKDVAAIIVEPIGVNNGLMLPHEGFLEGLRSICDEHNILLIFDEVVTGFRLRYGSAIDVVPDLVTLGKIIGGGFPIGAFGGKAKIMKRLAPEGPVYQAGTFSGNPISISAGLATLNILKTKKIYSELARKGKILKKYLGDNMSVVGSMFGFNLDENRFRQLFISALKHGIYLSPSIKEVNFVSIVHSDSEIKMAADELIKLIGGIK